MKSTTASSRFNHKLDIKNGKVEMAHGAGGKAMAQLIDDIFLRAFSNPALDAQADQAMLGHINGKIVMATDSHVIKPLFFPGGNIGSLSVHGTVNDVAMSGAKPLYLSCGFILEEGFALADLKVIVDSMAQAAIEAGVQIVTGDTKVVDKGLCDGVYINTTGIGELPRGVELSTDNIEVGDKILVSGTIGDHGVAIMSYRENLTFETTTISDSQSLNRLTDTMMTAVPEIKCMRDPTRGGIAATLNEIAQQARVGISLTEAHLPVCEQVSAACEILGLDPLNVANEGKLLVFCPASKAEQLLVVMQNTDEGKDAAIIGEVTQCNNHFVQLKTAFGGTRMVDWINGEQLPRIC
jgi:hydrogenase expression/formation protein HypE